jgi:capsular exopolysaccharide synthesis family protein
LSFALIGRRVLIIDADLRRPSIHRSFAVSNRRGLTNALLAHDDCANYVLTTPYENLTIMTSGPIPPNPAELLMSAAMEHLLESARAGYDMVFVDCPPAGIVTDAAIVATKVDGTLFITRSGFTDKRLLAPATGHLKQVQARVLGFIFNGVEQDSDDYYYQHYYYTEGEPHQKRNRRHQPGNQHSQAGVRKVISPELNGERHD